MQIKFARMRPRSTTFTVMVIALLTLTGRDAIGLSATPEEIQQFEELMAAKWLTCKFEPIETVSGDILDRIGFDPEKKRTYIITTTPNETEKGLLGILTQPGGPFGLPMTLVFDDAKSRARLHFPIKHPKNNQPHDDQVSVEVASVNVQQVNWFDAGALRVTIIWRVFAENSFVGNVVIFPAKAADESFAAIANIFMDLGMFVVSARCTADIGDEIRPDVEKIRSELEGGSTR